jgi:peptide/nickel transport system permease protein
MKRFIVFAGKRVLFTVPELLAVSVIVFFLIRLLPGDPTYMLAGPYATVERIGEVRSNLGLDQPLFRQYADYSNRPCTGIRVSFSDIAAGADFHPALPATTLEAGGRGRPGFRADRRAAGRRGRRERGGIADRLVFVSRHAPARCPISGSVSAVLVFSFALGVPPPVGQLDFAYPRPTTSRVPTLSTQP